MAEIGQPKRIEYLDWLRALAAGLVIFGHSMNPIAPGGAIGVSVFFVLSGYLIASILLRDGMMTIPNIIKFIIRRILRIYPMYALAVGASILFFWMYRTEHMALVWRDIPGLLIFQGNTRVWLGYGFGVLWTLAVEFWFYVTFPFLLWGAILTRHVVACICAGIAVSLAAKVFQFGGDTLHYYDHFLLGSLCAALIKYDAIPAALKRRGWYLFGYATVLLIAATPFPGSRGALWFMQSLGAAVASALIILAGHLNPPKLSLPAISYLGRISYSGYLLHAIVLDYTLKQWGVVTNFPLYFAVVIAASSSTYFLLERPIESMAHRFIRYGKPNPIVAPQFPA